MISGQWSLLFVFLCFLWCAKSFSHVFGVVVRWTLNYLFLYAARNSYLLRDIQSLISLRGEKPLLSAKAAIECKDRNLFLIHQKNMTENHNVYAIICKNYECKSYYHQK